MNEATHEAEVSSRFDLLHARFHDRLADEDYRLRGLLDWMGPLDGSRILDVGSGKGRFSRAFRERGAAVVGIDLSLAMLAGGRGLDRVRGSARRLPFSAGSFDRVVAVEVLEHLASTAIEAAIGEFRRVLRPGGLLAIVDKNAGSLNSKRPWLPNLIVKRVDEYRGLWMYPNDGPVRERWFWPSLLRSRLQKWFHDVDVVHLLSPAESRHLVFRKIPRTRCMTLWGSRVSGGTLDDA
jgi:2-polyprenyl-6-hydroxyphenyl methylase/3-demethylubiquinone-9 3-methyltransferase